MTKNNLICAITGPTEGIGRATAEALARQGYSLILLCRNPDKAAKLATDLEQIASGDIETVLCDLSDLDSVREAANRIAAHYERLDLLINNAGVVLNKRQLNDAGLEMMFATNHLGHFLLTR